MGTQPKQQMLFDTGHAKKPVLISACLLGIPCRYHGRRAKRRACIRVVRVG